MAKRIFIFFGFLAILAACSGNVTDEPTTALKEMSGEVEL